MTDRQGMETNTKPALARGVEAPLVPTQERLWWLIVMVLVLVGLANALIAMAPPARSPRAQVVAPCR